MIMHMSQDLQLQEAHNMKTHLSLVHTYIKKRCKRSERLCSLT